MHVLIQMLTGVRFFGLARVPSTNATVQIVALVRNIAFPHVSDAVFSFLTPAAVDSIDDIGGRFATASRYCPRNDQSPRGFGLQNRNA